MPEPTGTIKWYSYMTRYYIKVISESSGKQTTFYPSTNIQIGDYGVVDKQTNEFKRRGNIFKDDEILGISPELATDDQWKPRTTSEEDKLVITHDMEMTDLEPNEGPKLRLQFKGIGEFLVLYRPRSVDLPQPIDLAKLSKIHKLDGMRLVTGVVTCPAYALSYNSDNETVNISLNFFALGILSKLQLVKQGWTCDVGGAYKDGYNSEGDHEYTPLFSLTSEISYEPSDGSDASDMTAPLVDLIKPRLPIPPPSAGDGNEVFKSGEIGVAPWLSGRSKRPEKWKNRPAAPSDPDGNREKQGDSHNSSAPERAREPPSTTAVNPTTRSNLKASGAADHSRYYDFDRMSEVDSDDCFPSWCCCK